jgi:phospholipid-translocating ATPase
MTFNKCSIRGKLYGYAIDNETGHEVQDIEKLTPIKFKEQDEDFVWYDQTLIDTINRGDDDDVNNFFTLLALCQTVMIEERDDKILYQAQSPDEKALVSAARSFGFAFMVSHIIERSNHP